MAAKNTRKGRRKIQTADEHRFTQMLENNRQQNDWQPTKEIARRKHFNRQDEEPIPWRIDSIQRPEPLES
jgi:hypothetical protein